VDIPLSRGDFGIVFKANLKYSGDSSEIVAVKKPNPKVDASYMKSVLSDLKCLVHLKNNNHPNVTSFVGACTSDIKFSEPYYSC
jgi:hypothetical protein